MTCRILRRRFSRNAAISAAGLTRLLSAAAFVETPLGTDGLAPVFLTAERNAHIETPFTIRFQGPNHFGWYEKLDFVNLRRVRTPRLGQPPRYKISDSQPVLFAFSVLLLCLGGNAVAVDT